MKQLTNLLIEFEEKVNKLVQELQHLKMRAYALEEENEKLRKEITEVYQVHTEDGKKKKEEANEGLENLARLYNEGFHVCHLHFGQSRNNSDCLFCMGFLKKGIQRDAKTGEQ